MIRARGVYKRFASGFTPLRDLHLEIEKGNFVSLVGPSGCGKTTLLRLLAGLDFPSQGTLEMDTHARSHTSFVFQEAHLLPWRSALANVMLPLELKRETAMRSRAMDALERVGLRDFAAFRPFELSGGMKMRVSLARALVTHPRLLLLDEPFAALDEMTRSRLDEEMWNLWDQSKMTVVFVTHSLPEAIFLSQRILFMSKDTPAIVGEEQIPLATPRRNHLRFTPDFLQILQRFQEQYSH